MRCGPVVWTLAGDGIWHDREHRTTVPFTAVCLRERLKHG
jgi:hypothetical protein